MLFRSGLGTETVAHLRVDAMVQNKMIRSRCLPWGLRGGKPGAGNESQVLDPEGKVAQVPRTDKYPLPAGHRVRMLTGGGGGYGNPFERDPEQVRLDVLGGAVSLKSAAEDYGVVIDPVTRRVDMEATRASRRR